MLAVEAMISGARTGDAAWQFLYYELMGALVANGVLMASELFMPEENIERMRATRLITRGYFSKLFWSGAVILGTILPLIALIAGAAQLKGVAVAVALLVLAGIYVWEHIWVQAGQAIPLS
jgi:hypothetical protein